jgi:ribosomal protein L10
MRRNTVQLFLAYSETYKNIIIIDHERVDSIQYKQMKTIVEKNGKMLNGKNSMFLNGIKLSKNENLKKLIPYIKNQICLIFTNKEVEFFEYHIRQLEYFVYQEIGTTVEEDIVIKAQSTNIEPNYMHLYTNSFPIPHKIRNGIIEFPKSFLLCKKGQKLERDHKKLLNKLEIKTQRKGFEIVVGFVDGEFQFPIDFTNFDFLLEESLNCIDAIAYFADYYFESKKEFEFRELYSSEEENLLNLFYQ